jgi:hypothetical protein
MPFIGEPCPTKRRGIIPPSTGPSARERSEERGRALEAAIRVTRKSLRVIIS